MSTTTPYHDLFDHQTDHDRMIALGLMDAVGEGGVVLTTIASYVIDPAKPPYNADITGLTDTSNAINLAIADGSVDFGGKDRVYLVNDNTINILSNRAYLGSGAIIKSTVHSSVHTPFSRTLFRNPNRRTPNSTVENVWISGLIFRTQIATTASRSGCIGITEVETIKNILIENCDLENTNCDGNGVSIGAGAQSTTTTPHCDNIVIRHNVINPGRAGIEVLNQAGPNITNEQVVKESMANVHIYGNRIKNAGQYANSVYAGLGISYSGPVDGLSCHHNDISGSWYAGVELTFDVDGNTDAKRLAYFVDHNHLYDNHRNIIINIGSSTPNIANARVRGIKLRNNVFANPWFKDILSNMGEGCEVTGNEFRVNNFRAPFTDGAGGTSAGNQLHPVDFIRCNNIKVKDNDFYVESPDVSHYAFCPRFMDVSDSDICFNRFHARGEKTAMEFGYTSELVARYFKRNRVRGNTFFMGEGAERVIMLAGNTSNNNFGTDNLLYAPSLVGLNLIDARINPGDPLQVGNDIQIATFNTTTEEWVKPQLPVAKDPGIVSTWQTIPGTYIKVLQVDNNYTDFLTIRFTLLKLASGGGDQFPGNSTAGATGSGQIPALFEITYSGVYNNKPIGGKVNVNFGTFNDPTRRPLVSYLQTGERRYVEYSIFASSTPGTPPVPPNIAASGSVTTDILTLPPTRNGRVDGRGDVVLMLSTQMLQHATVGYSFKVQLYYSLNGGSSWLICQVCSGADNSIAAEYICPASTNGNYLDFTVIRHVPRAILSVSGEVKFKAIITSLDTVNSHDMSWNLSAKELVTSDYGDSGGIGETACTPRIFDYAVDVNGNRYFDLQLPANGIRTCRIMADIKPIHHNAYSVSIL